MGEPPTAPDPAAARSAVVLLEVAGQTVAVRADDVVEVGRLGPVTPLSGAEPWVLGVTAVRGTILLVVDLPRLLGHAAAPADHSGTRPAAAGDARVVVVGRGPWRAGLVGAAVREVAEASPASGPAERTPAAAAGAPGLPVRGAVRPDHGGAPDAGASAVPLLDVAALLHALHDDAPAVSPDPP